MKNNALTIQLDSLKESCCNAMKYNTSCLSYNLKLLSALADAVYIRDYLSELFDKWKKELPFIGDRDFINCDWSKEENSIRELVSEVQENLKDYYCQTTKFDLPSLNTPSEVKPRNYSNLVLGELYGNILPDDWDKMLKEKFPISDETVGWAVAKELYSEVSVDNNDVNRAAIKIIQKAIPFIGHSQYLDCMDCKLVEVLDDIANSLRKIYQLLTQPHTIIKDKYQLEDAFTAFFKRVYMEYALDNQMYGEYENEFEAFRTAYLRKNQSMDFYPWITNKCWNDFKSSGFLIPYSRDFGENIENFSHFNKRFSAPDYYRWKEYQWIINANAGQYIYYYQLREEGWLEKTKAFLHFLILVDLYRHRFENVSTEDIEKTATQEIKDKSLILVLQRCFQQISIIMEEENRIDKDKWQKGDWVFVYDVCKEENLIKENKKAFARAIGEAVKNPECIESITTILSQNSVNSHRAKNEERKNNRCKEIRKLLLPIIDEMRQ